MPTRRALLTAVLAAVPSMVAARGREVGDGRSLGDDVPRDLRLLRVRHRTLLVEIGGRRALVDPCFAPALGAGILWSAGPPALAPEETGDIELLLVSSREPGAFDGGATARLRQRDAACLVPDERTATILRHQGFRRVRVVVPGDVVETRGVVVRVSPSASVFGVPAVGFHLERNGRSMWHAGSPPPLDVAAAAARFAREQPAEVVAAAAGGLSLAGAPRTLDREDALLLAGLARARYAVLLDEDVSPSAAGRLLLHSSPGPSTTAPGVSVRIVVVEPGRWYRVMPR